MEWIVSLIVMASKDRAHGVVQRVCAVEKTGVIVMVVMVPLEAKHDTNAFPISQVKCLIVI